MNEVHRPAGPSGGMPWRAVGPRLTVAAAAVACAACGFIVGHRVGVGGPGIGPAAIVDRLPRVHGLGALTSDTFAACTCPMDLNAEGFFILDFLTGDLMGGVISPQAGVGKFTRMFSYNVLADLGVKADAARQPRFLLLAGGMNFVGPGANTMAQSVLYVTDVATGVTAAYAIPWMSQQSRVPGRDQLVLLDIARPRGGGAVAP
jgi:hypothetical protein